jgi:glutamate-1-semialdehyde 2,1-aminomutase
VGLFFSETPVVDYASAQEADGKRYARFFHEMLDRGVYLAPSPFEALFPSLAHGPADIEAIVTAAGEAATAVAAAG